MDLWDIAYSAGPNYIKTWRYFDPKDLRDSIQRANNAIARAAELSDQVTPAEQALVMAIAARFPPTDSIPNDLSPYDRALFADALMCITPRGLWDLDTGEPTGPHTLEARKVIETGLASTVGRAQPALCHLYIHIMEMCPNPELALPAADRLRYLVLDGSHMLHMPTHIDAVVGDYRRAIDSNNEAIMTDDKYFAQESGTISYIGYRVHYICAKLYAAMMCGRFTDAMAAAKKLEEVITDDLLSITSPPVADSIESFLGSKVHVLICFGRWKEISRLELPANCQLQSATTAIILYSRGLAYSALGRIEEAETTQREFELARAAVPKSRLNSIPCRQVDVLRVSSAMLRGELKYRKGNHTHLTTATAILNIDGINFLTDPYFGAEEDTAYDETTKLINADLSPLGLSPLRLRLI
ncbi:uncharacterized protein BDV14DRAFT_194780 [Aspergillus stella-maris]|uniref:uncharacterized protein n=1 Tax=Aspergillus stella-maris TaxID=1810926 RepID=UPI003CCDB127